MAVVQGDFRPDCKSIPDDCPEDLKEIPSRCWKKNPDERPLFRDLGTEMFKYSNTTIHVKVEEDRVNILRQLKDCVTLPEEEDFSYMYGSIQDISGFDGGKPTGHGSMQYESVIVAEGQNSGEGNESDGYAEPDECPFRQTSDMMVSKHGKGKINAGETKSNLEDINVNFQRHVRINPASKAKPGAASVHSASRDEGNEFLEENKESPLEFDCKAKKTQKQSRHPSEVMHQRMMMKMRNFTVNILPSPITFL
ncbi:uncharacterized protein [Ptychodera flava]|uniref:uncharacterized protein n=1 Tax=Ptychodera flava TaxID=63121 RepID=UPI00396A4C48